MSSLGPATAAVTLPLEDGAVVLAVINDGQFKAVRNLLVGIRIDDKGTCYDSPNDGPAARS
jgi:hypothetical protein